MIKIDTSKIEKWEEIKIRHSEWYGNFVLPKLKLVIIILEAIYENRYSEIKRYIFLLREIEKRDKNFVLQTDFKKCASLKSKKIFLKTNDNLGKKIESKLQIQLKNVANDIIKNKLTTIGKKINTLDELKEIKKKYDGKKDNNDFLSELEKYSNININLIKWYIENKPTSKKKINENFLNACIFKIDSYKDLLPESIFDYDSFSDKAKEKSMNWGRHSLLTMMGIEVCPYCQRNYITNYNDEYNKELTTADLDHFYPQAQYPYLALSLYNFIPSCHTCNSSMKGGAPIGINTHIYPYTDSMEEDIKFTIETDSFMDNVFTKNQNLNIDIDVNIVSKEGKEDTNRLEKIKNSLKTFKLKEVYKNSHSKYVGDLIHNFQKYPKSYTKALGEIFLETPKESNEEIKKELEEKKSYQEKLQILNDNFQEIIKKPYTDKIEKGEPLAKLTKDIMEELGIK